MTETRHALERADRLEIELILERQARANREVQILQERAAELGRQLLTLAARVVHVPEPELAKLQMRLEADGLVLVRPEPDGNGRAGAAAPPRLVTR